MKSVHFIGIGGIGMSGLARILLKRGCMVTGSDASCNPQVESLKDLGARIACGHNAVNVPTGATVVYSTAIKEDNPEYCAALAQGCPLMHRSDLLNELMQEQRVLAVTGTHGKTSSSGLLATTLVEAGFDPSFAVGGVIPQLGVNADGGEGKYFVIEADESDGSFTKYTPFGAIVTNIDADHMDHFGTNEALESAFVTFVDRVQSDDHLFWCGDDARLKGLVERGHSYGFAEENGLRIKALRTEGWSQLLDIDFEGKCYDNVELTMPGQHNALNALAVFGLAIKAGVNEESIRKSFSSFKGVCRRCEKKGEVNGIVVLDDYAHHPTEIGAMLKAMRQAVGKRRVVALYQPHRYSRTKNCMGSFGTVFDSADQVFITDIYAAGESPIEGVSGEVVAKEVSHSYIPRDRLVECCMETVQPGDLVVTIGAGDITCVGSELVERLQEGMK